jgi:hypothetical protein
MTGRIELELTFEDESPDAVKAMLREAGASNIESRPAAGFTGIETGLVCFLLAGEIAKLIRWLVQSWKRGVIVVVHADGKVTTEKNRDIPAGSVLLVRPDGTQVTLQEPTEPQIGAWFKDVFKAASATG